MESVNATEVSLKMMTLMIVSHVQFQDVNSVIKPKYVTHVLLKSISNKPQKMEPVSVKLTITLWIIRQNV